MRYDSHVTWGTEPLFALFLAAADTLTAWEKDPSRRSLAASLRLAIALLKEGTTLEGGEELTGQGSNLR